MKLQKPNTPFNQMDVNQLLTFIDGIRALSIDVVEQLSEALSELRKHRVKHHFFNDRILSFWREINSKQLAAEAAIGLANRPMIMAVLPLPHKDQVEITHGKEIAVANYEGKTEHLPIHRMDGPTLKRAFGPDGIRSIKAQAEMIHAAGKIERIGMITILRDENAVKVSGVKLTWEEIGRAARQAGHRLILNELGPDQADKAG